MRHAEELATRLAAAREAIDRATDQLGGASTELQKAAELDPSLRPLTDQSATTLAVLADLTADLRVAFESVRTDPQTAEETEQRLALLGDLRRKYGDTLAEVLEFGEGANRRREELAGVLVGAERLADNLQAAEEVVTRVGALLREVRQQTAEAIAVEAVSHLQELGMPAPVVRMLVDPAEPGPAGADTARLLFASDDRLGPAPVGRVASGGELSRLVLSLRLAGGSGRTPVIAFDEIDAGMGGKTALALGQKLASLSRDRQVLCVTHLPQVAAFADRHFVIKRTGTTVAVSEVGQDERLEELSRMLAGLPDSQQGRDHADELIALATRQRSE
jgi:DNA repair protein RecN (Recombination protein N)